MLIWAQCGDSRRLAELLELLPSLSLPPRLPWAAFFSRNRQHAPH